MGKTPLPKDEALQPLNVKVPMEDLYFLQEELKPAFGVSCDRRAGVRSGRPARRLSPATGGIHPRGTVSQGARGSAELHFSRALHRQPRAHLPVEFI